MASSARRKTLLANEIPNFDEDDIDEDAEKKKRVSDRFDQPNSLIRRNKHRIVSESRIGVSTTCMQTNLSKTLNQTNVNHGQCLAKPTNEQLSSLYNNCVKLLNENKINAKNAFQLKLIDYMSDIVLNKEIVGGVTNFQVVGCTIDVGTKIYAARVDALHHNTYQMLSGLGHGTEENENKNITSEINNSNDNLNDDGEIDENENNKRNKFRKKRVKKCSQIAENLETITSKSREEFQDEDLYFSKISTSIENEALSGTLLNKLHFKNDSFKTYINADDKVFSTSNSLEQDTTYNFQLSNGIQLNLKEIVEMYKQKFMDLKNLKLCSELSGFRFIGWNLETNDEISKLVESMTAEDENLEQHRFDVQNGDHSHLFNFSIHSNNVGTNPDLEMDEYINNEIDGDVDNNDHLENNHQSELESLNKIDDFKAIGSVHSVADLTTLISQSPNDYSYFDKFKLQMHNLPKDLRHIEAFRKDIQSSKSDDPLINHNPKISTVRNKKEAPRLDLSIDIDRAKYFKVTKKATFLCDRTIEKRSEKALRLETERQYEYNAKELFQPYYKTIAAKIFSDSDLIENFLLNNDDQIVNSNGRREIALNNFSDDEHIDGIEDNFDIPQTGNEPFFTQGGSEFDNMSQQLYQKNDMNDFENVYQKFEGENLIEAPLQVNALNIEYAKTSKNIDVRKLKQVIWGLLYVENDKENIDESSNEMQNEQDFSKINSSITIKASLKNIYMSLRPPLISQRVFDDLSICIVFQMLLFLANEHNLILKNDPIGSDVLITNY